MSHINNTYNVGVNPASISITPNGKYGYVANSNNYGIPNGGSVTVLDLKKGVPKLTIHDTSFVEPYRIGIDHDGNFAYVCNSGSPISPDLAGTLSIIDVKENKVVGTIIGFDGPGAIAISNHNIAYVTNYGAQGGLQSGNGKTVSVVDLNEREIIDTIEVDLAPSSLILSSDDKVLYVICYVDGNPGTGKLHVISTKTNKIIKTISGLFGPFGIALTKNGNLAYVTNFGSNNFEPYGTTVSVICLHENKIIKNISVGIQPCGIAITNEFAYISNYNVLYAGANSQNLTPGEGTINIICLKHNKVISPTISVGQSPSTITLSSCGKKLYVSKYIQNTVAELHI
jgi:YVTN family beta-propeller protein